MFRTELELAKEVLNTCRGLWQLKAHPLHIKKLHLKFTCTFYSRLNKLQITMFFPWITKEELQAHIIKLIISVFFLGGKKKDTKNTLHSKLFVKWVKVAQSCPTICDPMDYMVHGILQARILEWVALLQGIIP